MPSSSSPQPPPPSFLPGTGLLLFISPTLPNDLLFFFFFKVFIYLGFPGGSDGKDLPAMQGTWVRSLGWEDPLEKGMATHSSIPAWRIPWTEESVGLQSMGSQRVGHDWSMYTLTFIYLALSGLSCAWAHLLLSCEILVPCPGIKATYPTL